MGTDQITVEDTFPVEVDIGLVVEDTSLTGEEIIQEVVGTFLKVVGITLVVVGNLAIFYPLLLLFWHLSSIEYCLGYHLA